MKNTRPPFAAALLAVAMLLQTIPAHAAWVVVYMAHSKDVAQRITKVLQDDKILVKSRPITKNAENNDNNYEILVSDTAVEQAHNVIIENGF